MTLRRILALAASLAAAGANAQGGIVESAGPQGGRLLYGPVPGVATPAQAMGAALTLLHRRFGARPEVGRVLEMKDSGSSTLRFTLRPPHDEPVAGMVVVAPGPRGLEAGVVYDTAPRIATSFKPLVQALTAAWHPAPAGEGGPAGPAAALRPVTLSDGSAKVGLPPGWRLDPHSSGGTILASGPNGEFAALGAPYFVLDPRSPQARQAQGMRGTVYAAALSLPFGMPLGRTFAELARQTGERANRPFEPIRVDSEEPMANRGGARCARLRGQGGIEAGRGQGTFDTVFCVSPPVYGSWVALAYHVAAPVAVAGREQATLLAVRASFEQNQQVVDRQASAMAAPVIAQIHEIGRQSARMAAEADAARIASRNRFESYNNTRDRLAQGFTNYLRDQTVILDANTNEHATTWNSVAEAMVKNEPNRYSYVDTPGYWKGVDY